jgi:hypothetical protein
MRRMIAGLAMVLVCAAGGCRSSAEGPERPASASQARGAPALLQAQVRGAALGFVEAYRATVLGGRELRAVAATPLMRRFAYWLGVTNRAFPGELSASSTVSALGPATVVGGDGQVLEVDVAAQIDVVAQPPDGEAQQLTVPLDGPVRFAATESGEWRIIDFVRFGVPVSGAFVPLDLDYARPGVRITLDSFGGVPNWSFFVRVASTGPRVLTIAEPDVTLVGADGTVVGEALDVSEPLLEIAPGGRIDGALSFEPIQDIEGVSLRIDVGGPDDDPVPLEIPLRTLLDPTNA